MSKIDTKELQKALSFVAPALSTHEMVPVLTHFCFTKDGWLEAYNGAMASSIFTDYDLVGALPGAQLLKQVGTFTEKNVTLTTEDEDTALLKGGRAKLLMKMIPESDFVYNRPADADAEVCFRATDKFFAAIKTCLNTVGNSHANVEQLGLTLQYFEDTEELYVLSTDNSTISSYAVDDLDLTFESRKAKFRQMTLPTDFCKQLMVMFNRFSGDHIDILLFQNGAMASIEGVAEVYTQVQTDYKAIDLQGIVDKHTDIEEDLFSDIPFALKSAMARAVACSGKDDTVATKVELSSGTMNIATSSGTTEVTDSFPDIAHAADVEISIDPRLVSRVLDHVDAMAFSDSALVLVSDKTPYTHIIAFMR